MMTRTTIASIALALLCLAFAAPDSGKADFMAMKEKYATANAFSMELTVRMEPQGQRGDTYTAQGTVHKQDGYYRTQLDQVTTVVNGDCVVRVDDGNKTMVCTRQTEAQLQQMDVASLAWPEGVEPRLVKREGKRSFYTIPLQGHMITRMEVELEQQELRRLTYYYAEEPGAQWGKVDIVYSNVRFDPGSSAKQFSLAPYIVKKGDQFQPTQGYAHYQFIDQYSK